MRRYSVSVIAFFRERGILSVMTSSGKICFAHLPHRAVLSLTGEDVLSFLQGVITGEVEELPRQKWLYAALLTPQGKLLFDFLLQKESDDGGVVRLECERARRDELAKRLGFYRLRAKVEIAACEEDTVVVWREDGGTLPEGWDKEMGEERGVTGGPDPRLGALGERYIGDVDAMRAHLMKAGFQEVESHRYERYRMERGVGEGAADLAPEGIFPMEGNLDLLKGVDFHKGCFIGQEVVSRTWRKGTARKRLIPVVSEQELPESGSDIRVGEAHLGSLCSVMDGCGLALVRLDRLAAAGDTPVMAGDVQIMPQRPDWMPVNVFTVSQDGE